MARPHALCYRGGNCKAAYERFGFDGITLSGEVWCYSSTAAEGPAWRRPPRCGVVQFVSIGSLPTLGYALSFGEL